MDQDKAKFDVMTHLTDIPMLGKQYVPGLWRQFEGGSSQPPMRVESVRVEEPVVPRIAAPTTSVQQTGKENASAQPGASFHRAVDKRGLPSPADVVAESSFSAPPPKMPRFD